MTSSNSGELAELSIADSGAYFNLVNPVSQSPTNVYPGRDNHRRDQTGGGRPTAPVFRTRLATPRAGAPAAGTTSGHRLWRKAHHINRASIGGIKIPVRNGDDRLDLA